MTLGHENGDDWWIYLIRTNKGQLYCGISKNIKRRFMEHTSGKGAKYLRGKSPLTLVWHQWIGDHSLALRCECAIKRLPKKKKEQLICDPCCFTKIYSVFCE